MFKIDTEYLLVYLGRGLPKK